ncbi:MAG: inositol monophosphatase family protein [Campylobacterota bacterium]|nr:inositol monophosphatase family protein [Campylobacterota bacterium]
MKKIEILKGIAQEAGKIVRDGFYANKKVTHKGLVDLVTDYDLLTEEFILESLKKDFPDYRLIGEESHPKQENYHSTKAIYIDPIDGTTNFIHGIPHLAISIGIWENGAPLMAVVYNPILVELFWAEAGEGAYCNGVKLSVSPQADLQQSLIATGFPYAKVNQGIEYKWVTQSITNLLPHIRDIRRLGAAALDLCYLAEGKTDAFYEIDLKPWDVAAGILILLEAGGQVTNTSGGVFDFDDRGVVASNGKIHTKLLEYLEDI